MWVERLEGNDLINRCQLTHITTLKIGIFSQSALEHLRLQALTYEMKSNKNKIQIYDGLPHHTTNQYNKKRTTTKLPN